MESVVQKWRKESKQDGVDRGVFGVISDRRVFAKTKWKVYKTVVRPALLYGLETVAMTKLQEAQLEVAELIFIGSNKDGQDKKWACKGGGAAQDWWDSSVTK